MVTQWKSWFKAQHLTSLYLHCNILVTICNDTVCKNDGKCESELDENGNTKFKSCTCKQGYVGEYCEINGKYNLHKKFIKTLKSNGHFVTITRKRSFWSSHKLQNLNGEEF